MKKIFLVLIALAVIVLFWFLFVKSAGGNCGFCPSAPAVQRIEYGCIGLKFDVEPAFGCLDCGTEIKCIGIVTNEKICYTYLNGFKNSPTQVACTNSIESGLG